MSDEYKITWQTPPGIKAEPAPIDKTILSDQETVLGGEAKGATVPDATSAVVFVSVSETADVLFNASYVAEPTEAQKFPLAIKKFAAPGSDAFPLPMPVKYLEAVPSLPQTSMTVVVASV